MNVYEDRLVPIVTIFGFRESGRRVIALEQSVDQEAVRLQRKLSHPGVTAVTRMISAIVKGKNREALQQFPEW
jgi:hypothetical protein